jgi:hypothetical protein
MANSTTWIDQISQTQASKEVTANAYFDAASPATLYGRRAATSSGLTWGFYGGSIRTSAGTRVLVANGTRSLTASTTNRIYADPANGTLTVVTTAFPAGVIPLYEVVTGTATVTSYTDLRAFVLQASYASADQAAAPTISATYEQSEVQAIATLANALRDALMKAGIIKGGA